MTRLARFLAKAQTSDGCWLWLAAKTSSGYGMFRWDSSRRITAHRASYLLFVGPIPSGYEVDHLCRTRACVRPDHLEAVSVAENRHRRHHARGEQLPNGRKTHCAHGHPFAGENLRITANGERVCRACGRENTRRHRAKRHA